MNSKKITLLLIYLAIGTVYLTAGLSKLAPDNIGNLIGPVKMQQLYNSPAFVIFMNFIAVIQVITGTLLLSQRYSVFGLMLAIPLSLGILIFTIVVGFGLTPIINLIFLLMLVYAYFQEKQAIRKIVKTDWGGLKDAVSYQLFPNNRYAKIAMGLIILTSIFSLIQKNIVLNILTTAAFLLYTANLFQRKDYLFIDKILIALFLLISIIVVDALYIKKIHNKATYIIFLLIPLGILIYIIRLFYWRFSKRHQPVS